MQATVLISGHIKKTLENQTELFPWAARYESQ